MDRWLRAAVVALLFAAAGMTLYYGTASGLTAAKIADTAISLETSRGRERKQQLELDAANLKLPRLQAETAELQPQAETAAAEVTALKTLRKQLREEKKTLTEQGRQP